jgi:hypothetical protein
MFPLIGPEMIEAWMCRPNECDEPARPIETSQRDKETAGVSYARVKITRRPFFSGSINLGWIARNRGAVGKVKRKVFGRFHKWVGA